MTRNPGIIQRLLLASAVSLMALAGCKDRIADPTQGFVDILTGDIANVEVFLDGVSLGQVSEIGPLAQGTYTVAVVRECYQVVPPSLEITVEPGARMDASFALTLGQSGSVRVVALDEILGTEVVGAEILLDSGSGLQPTGVTTPGTVNGVPCGLVTVGVRRAGFASTGVEEVVIVPFETAETALDLGPPHAVLAEMFTFISCAGCPQAASELEEIQEADPLDFYVIEWHSEFPFPLYDVRWRERLTYYVGAGNPGKPLVAFQGATLPSHDPPLLQGSEESELAEYHTRTADYLALCDGGCPVGLKVFGSISGTEADADVRLVWRGGTVPSDLVLRVVLIENHVSSPGNAPYFSYVPRDIHEEAVSFSTAGEVLTVTPPTFPVSAGWDSTELHFVAWVQSESTHEILAVGGN
ncbi:MAG: hypothetical protein DHS20C21_06380 [Gemmatimonadota bacterium]|nr:MAG: hypothetical protein DHS20C21_06380 [Gemmatimonadota bacterium]